MQSRRHHVRKRQRRDSAREWIRSGAAVTVKAYARRYGVDRFTAYDDLTALGFRLPAAAQQWAQRPAATPRRRADLADPAENAPWIVVDGRSLLVVGCTSGGAPYGMFEDEMQPSDGPPPADFGT
jgi:hypothetical protein